MSRISSFTPVFRLTRSIHAPFKSVKAATLASLANIWVSKRPIWLVEAAG